MHKPKVSVVCRTYNHSHCINETIDSILSQTFSDWELIISDDCSSDDTVEKIKKYKDERIKLFVNEKNLGIIGNLNKVISLAQGEYISILDGDDAYLPEKLQKQVNFLDNNPDYGAVFSYLDFIGVNNKIKSIYKDLLNIPSGAQEEMLLKFFFYDNYLAFPTEMFRSEFKFVFPENLIALGDCNFHVNTLLKTKIKVIEEPLVKYRISSKGVQASTWTTLYSMQIERVTFLDSFLQLKDNVDLFKRVFKDKYEKFGLADNETIPFLLSRLAMELEANRFWGYYIFSKLVTTQNDLATFLKKFNLTYKDYISIKNSESDSKKVKNYKKMKRILERIVYFQAFIILLLLYFFIR